MKKSTENKLQEAKEYLKEVNSLTTREELYKIGTQIQIDAYNQALEDVTESATTECTFVSTGDYSGLDKWIINKESILKLKK